MRSSKFLDAILPTGAFRVALFAAALSLYSFGETVTVADCERDASIDYWAAADVGVCKEIMDEVFAMAGVQVERAKFDEEGIFSVDDAEVICSAFRTQKLLENYLFPLQPLGAMHFALYTTPERSEELLGTKITDWPRMKVAYSPVSQGSSSDREDYFKRADLSPEFVEYRTSEGAVDALRVGDVDVLFLYTAAGKRPEGLVEIVPIGMRSVYFAVRKDRPELLKRLSAAYREWYIDNIDKYDAWREQQLGIPKPEKRVRIAAYSRGDLFNVSPDGLRSGIIEDWMRSLCAITHWTPDYVYGDYDQSLEDVKNGRLDIVGGLGFSANRSNSFLYPHTPIGMLRVYLWARPESPYLAGRPDTWGGMKIGLLSGTLSARLVKKQMKEKHYDFVLQEFESDRKLKDAYFSGKIDACVDIEMSELANERALRIYASHPMYLVSTPKNRELFHELEAALDEVCDDFFKYMRMITERHYGAHTEMSELTMEETEWLHKRQSDPTPIVIDFSPWPFDILDENGKPDGLPKAIIDELSEKTRLKFELSPQTGIQTAAAKFLRGDTQFWIQYPMKDVASAYGSVSVFSLPVPQSCATLYGANDLRMEFEMITHRETPNELVSILRKIMTGIEPTRFQEMFMAAVAERMAEQRFLGLTITELKEYALAIGIITLVIIIAYGSIMIILLKRHARRAEESARAAHEFAQAKTRFLAMMSHELRTPLNAVIGFAEFLSKDSVDEIRRHEYVDGILKSATALLDLINDILDFSKLEAGAMKMREGNCDIDKCIGELQAIFGYRIKQRGVSLEIKRIGDIQVPLVRFSHQALRQILLNIVGNSAKFTEKGKIQVKYGWIPENNTLRIEICDTGRGISDAKMKKLFDPFTQDIASRMKDAAGSEIKGTGLGLPIVKQIVDAVNGTIRVNSVLGKGTSFIIEIPGLEVIGEVSREEVVPQQPAELPDKPMPNSVLIVDDMMMNRKILGIHLANLGIKDVHFAENGLKALEEMKSWTPDVVLTDMWMPEMDGQALAEAMRKDQRLARIPVVAVTADVDIDSSYNMSIFAKVMAKPVTGDKLTRLFREL